MNRTRSFRLTCLAVVLLLAVVFSGCTDCDGCLRFAGIFCPPEILGVLAFPCILFAAIALCPGCYGLPTPKCINNPDECAATYEQMQLTAIELCEEYPEECQEYFDSWVESFEEEAEE